MTVTSGVNGLLHHLAWSALAVVHQRDLCFELAGVSSTPPPARACTVEARSTSQPPQGETVVII